jgi:hypothetical protein
MCKLDEKKEHLIKKMPNLSDEQKLQLITFFNTHPEAESKVNWNNLKTLTFDDFKPLLNTISKSAQKKAVKVSGIQGLIEGQDYVTVFKQEYQIQEKEGDPVFIGTAMGYAPLSWKASQFIASSYVGTAEITGEWCTSYSKDPMYWDTYCGKEGKFFIYCVDYRPENSPPSEWGKVAIETSFDYTRTYNIWNSDDKKIFNSDSSSADILRYRYRENGYPDFLFDTSIMFPFIKNASSLINRAGGIKAGGEIKYFVRSNVDSARDGRDNILYITVSWNATAYDVTNETPVNDDSFQLQDNVSTIKFVKVGQDATSMNANFVYNLSTFYGFNGVGAYIHYQGYSHDTINEVRDSVQRQLEDVEVDVEDDTYEINLIPEVEKDFKIIFPESLDYIIVDGKYLDEDSDINECLDVEIQDFIETLGYFDFERCEIIKDKDISMEQTKDPSKLDSYIIIVADWYDPTKPREVPSTPLQRRNDKQLKLPFGL